MKELQGNTDNFTHSGVISKIDGESLIVTLDENVHCESCRAKAICGVSDSTSKEIEINQPAGDFQLNESVVVKLKKDLGAKAVFWAYILPFFLMVGTLIIASFFVVEWLAGVFSLVVLLPYYALLHFLKDAFAKTFSVTLVNG